jgi:sugar lactone lactonase YvrE
VRLSTGLFIALAAGAVSILAACSGTPQSNSVGLPQAGSAAQYLRAGSLGRPDVRGIKLASGRVLYVDDAGANAVDVLEYHRWTKTGTITNGVGLPSGNWVDRKGNLYVANEFGPSVTEYDSSGNLIFTYSAGMVEPVAVTTDKAGDVYEVDYNGNDVNEYPQAVNSPTSCSIDYPAGVAVDKRGDVFVTAATSTRGVIVEYRRGLIASDCAGTVLPVSLGSPEGIAIDKQGNLVVCDAETLAVDIIAPPYANVTGTLGSGWSNPYLVTIDKTGTQAYVSNIAGSHPVIRVLTYPDGSNVATLGTANGLTFPVSAVDSKNYVP